MSKSNSKTAKSAIITGAASGIGKETALVLASEKCNIYLLDKDERGLKKVNSSLSKSKHPIKVGSFVCDVTDAPELKNIRDKVGKIDYLVNVAGTSINQTKGVLDESAFDRLIEVNLKSAFLTSMIFGYGSIKKNGVIVNVSSIRARTGTPSYSSGYAAAKAGLINLTKSMALELAEKNIRVNAVAPGPTYPTKLSKNWSPRFREELAQTIPLKRLARPRDVSDAVSFLLSDKANYITGHTLDVNGGLWMN